MAVQQPLQVDPQRARGNVLSLLMALGQLAKRGAGSGADAAFEMLMNVGDERAKERLAQEKIPSLLYQMMPGEPLITAAREKRMPSLFDLGLTALDAPDVTGLGKMGAKALIKGMPPIIAFHGTGAAKPFAKFSKEFIGSGEGAQSFGYGLYFAESPGVANTYRGTVFTRGRTINTPEDLAQRVLADHRGNREAAIRELEGSRVGFPSADAPALNARVDGAVAAIRGGIEPAGQFYRVKINAEPEDFLDWDKPLSEQSPKVREALERAGFAPSTDAVALSNARTVDEKAAISMRLQQKDFPGVARGQPYDIGGRELIGSMNRHFIDQGMTPRAAEAATSEALREAGIPGIRYLDAGSRKAAEGTRNIVLFDEDLIDILEVNGKPVHHDSEEYFDAIDAIMENGGPVGGGS